MKDPCEAPNKTKDSKKKVTKSAKRSVPPKTVGSLIEFPHILRIIGPKHIKIFMQFVPSAIVYSITSLLLVTYMSDWKTVLQYLPYYNGKYYVEKKESKMASENMENDVETVETKDNVEAVESKNEEDEQKAK